MKKNTHPFKQKTLFIFHNGSTAILKLNFFKKILQTDSDFLNTKLWRPLKQKKF